MTYHEKLEKEQIGRLQRVELRNVWSHEAHDFTRWLEQNIDVLNDAIGFTLSIVERETAAGDFRVDLVAEDESGQSVIIENQLERSNHDHLGKLLTYLTVFEAKTAIWIVKEARAEHIGVISWLNELSPSVSFYLLKLEAVKIDDSRFAPLLTLIMGPSEEIREIGETKKEFNERDSLRFRFFTQLIERSQQKTPLFQNISPSATSNNMIRAGAGKAGVHFAYLIQAHTADVELRINNNEELFNMLLEKQVEIQQAFGQPLEWRQLQTDRNLCRISKKLETGGYRDDQNRWAGIQDTMIDAMIKLEQVFKPHIK